MSERLPMNSESLKARFPEVYQEFFSKCAIVCSAPRSSIWVGEYAIGSETIAVRQPLPIRTYVGLAPIRAAKIKMVSSVAFDPSLSQFQEIPLEEDLKTHIEEHLLDLWQTIFPETAKGGFEIHILAERPLGCAIGGAGSLTVPLIIALLLVQRRLSTQDLDGWSARRVADLIADPETKFDFVFRLIWKIETALYYTPSGASHFIPLVPSGLPVLFSSKRPIESVEIIRRVRQGKKVDLPALIDQSSYWGARTSDIFGEHVGWPLPFDWGIISTPHHRMVHDIVFTGAELQDQLKNDVASIEKIVQSLFGSLEDPHLPAFVELCTPAYRDKLWQHYIGSINLLSLQGLLKLKLLIESGFSEKPTEEFFQIINKIHATFYTFGFCSEKINELVYLLRRRIVEKIGRQEVGVKLNSTSRRGNILFATPAGLARPWFNDILDSLKTQTGEKISLDYASWIDGYEKEGGVKVEQFLDEGIRAASLEADSLHLLRWNKKGDATASIVRLNEIKIKGADIIFDSVHDKVYIKGKECTSNELPSQKAAVEILGALLEKTSHSLSNRDLPKSSYSAYRNEMQGKIVTPLTKLVKERLKKELRLDLEGSLTEFRLSFDSKGLEIGLIKKL